MTRSSPTAPFDLDDLAAPLLPPAAATPGAFGGAVSQALYLTEAATPPPLA